jgi:Holliday junction resolvase-like predicted endonuclease
LEYLEERRYSLVERNHRTSYGEIDLIMRDEETLVFIPEYKANSGDP